MLELMFDECGEIVEQGWTILGAAMSSVPESALQDYAVRRLHCLHLRLSSKTAYVTRQLPASR